MSERKVVLDEPELFDNESNALRAATDRAERAEAELAKLKAAEGTTGKAAKPAAAEADNPPAPPKQAQHPPQRESRVDDAQSSSAKARAAGTSERARPGGSSSGDSEERREAAARVHAGDDASESKQPPSPSSANGEPGVEGGEAELRRDSMMAHLLDSLDAGKDIGHYGRLVFAMVARHFLPHAEVLAWMQKDRDFGEEDARLMLRQVEGRDYSPPKRARILEWQAQQEFPILPDPEDPDCGNLYRNLRFPQEIYQHIGHYQEQKMESEES